ncbi:putative phospholipid-transporting ATPase [Lachnellula occidentalis]|uniref:Phospholipid-transporting ATPase n=1 Tax=Lachnellula occidentalis TaxID=215460 RepID=A0A8H8RNH2_9HELO|nr:putative phospholipid-transporting ATPase [Lachnellula occidentalis]
MDRPNNNHSPPKKLAHDTKSDGPSAPTSIPLKSPSKLTIRTSPESESSSGTYRPPGANLAVGPPQLGDSISIDKLHHAPLSQHQKIQNESKNQKADWGSDASRERESDAENQTIVEDEAKNSISQKRRFKALNLPKWSNKGIQRKTNFWYKKYIIQGILRQKEIQPTNDGRRIELDVSRDSPLIDERTGKPYISNSIRSSRYTIWNFLPKQIWFQFSKAANFFFLVVGILQLVPGLSTTGSFTTILPLLFFLLFIIIREGYDDVRRYQLDKVDNGKAAHVLYGSRSSRISLVPTRLRNPGINYWHRFRQKALVQVGKGAASVEISSEEYVDDANSGGSLSPSQTSWFTVQWKDIKVGDVVELKRNDPIPADIVLLYADGRDGIAYIETMSLDGETNLKIRRPPNLLSCETLADISQCHATFVVEDPNADLYQFHGKVTVNGQTSPVTQDNMVYRGSTLRNTNRAFGMVINTGEECKIRMNASRNPKPKAPAVQGITNQVVILLVVFVILLATGCTAGYYIWMTGFEREAWYLKGAHLGPAEIFIAYAIEFNNLIPLALYVSLELVKLAQFLLLHDVEMYDEASNTPMVSNTQNIYENLGQVSYLFSDKTGTLTENIMRFRKISVAGLALVHDSESEVSTKEKDLQLLKRPSLQDPTTPTIVEHEALDTPRPSRDGFPFPVGRKSLTVPRLERSMSRRSLHRDMSSKELLRSLWKHPDAKLSEKVRFFLLSLALCHTCFPEARKDGKSGFQAASPDELALVEAAGELGYIVTDRTTRLITLSIDKFDSKSPAQEVYEVLDIIEFSSKRKRMSIVVKFPDGRICLFCKGADSVIQPRLRLSAMALQKASEVRQRQDQRKSVDVEEAIMRKSHDEQSRRSLQRSSFQLDRPSMELRRIITGRKSVTIDEYPPSPQPVFQRNDYEAQSSPRKSSQLDRRFLSLPMSEPSTPRIVTDQSMDDATIFERCLEDIDDFASEGLRTLMFGYRFIAQDEYEGWSKLYHDATTSLVNRQEMIESAAEIVEQELDLAGATGIEDKLQDGVPETIEKLQRAHIKIWMLTGDKRETAINIAHSAKLCKSYSRVLILDHKQGPLKTQIDSALFTIMEGRIAHSVVVIDGQTLMGVENDDALSAHFYNLLLRADSTICCRASPAQKASMVKNIRHKVPSSITLAIGDGGNDIAMIQEAHVGVGISGKEGLQAARVADYSIAQFRFLQRLLLVHGHWNYDRIAQYALATFWKEMLFYCIQLLYQKWNGYTGTSLYENWSLTVWNTLFTSLCVMIPGIFEQDISAETLLAVPEIYSYGQNCTGFNLKKCGWWMLKAAVEAVIVYFMIYCLYGRIIFTRDQGLFAIGDLAFTVCVIFINVKLLVLDSHYKTWIPIFSVTITLLGWGVWNVFLSLAYANTPGSYSVYSGFVHHFGANPAWWATLVVVLGVLFACEMLITTLKKRWCPNIVDVWQEIEREQQRLKRHGGVGVEEGDILD